MDEQKSLGAQFDDLTARIQVLNMELESALEKRRTILKLLQSIISPTRDLFTKRERRILQGILKEQVNKEIACELNITVRTVKAHISSMLAKTGCQNRNDLRRRVTDETNLENKLPISSVVPMRQASALTALIGSILAATVSHLPRNHYNL
jgi:DNA-binding NarL/FixJ family response regulator